MDSLCEPFEPFLWPSRLPATGRTVPYRRCESLVVGFTDRGLQQRVQLNLSNFVRASIISSRTATIASP
jgi:hypothetical protein